MISIGIWRSSSPPCSVFVLLLVALHADSHAALVATARVALCEWRGHIYVVFKRLLKSDGDAASDGLGVEADAELWLRLLLV